MGVLSERGRVRAAPGPPGGVVQAGRVSARGLRQHAVVRGRSRPLWPVAPSGSRYRRLDRWSRVFSPRVGAGRPARGSAGGPVLRRRPHSGRSAAKDLDPAPPGLGQARGDDPRGERSGPCDPARWTFALACSATTKQQPPNLVSRPAPAWCRFAASSRTWESASAGTPTAEGVLHGEETPPHCRCSSRSPLSAIDSFCSTGRGTRSPPFPRSRDVPSTL